MKKDKLELKTIFDNLDLKQKIQFIHENELIEILGLFTSGEYDNFQDTSKERIKNQLWQLKLCLVYMVDDYLNENIEESE